MGGLARVPADAGPAPLNAPSPPLVAMQAVARAEQACADLEVEPGVSMRAALQDPGTRAQAARWRSGSEPRRVTAILARMLQSLQRIRPGWGCEERTVEMPVAEPLPVRPQPAQPSAGSFGWRSVLRLPNCLATVKGYWRTMAFVVLAVMFPKVFAMLATLVIRLLCRAVLVLLGRVASEIGRELHTALMQFSYASSTVEEWLVAMADEMMGFSHPLPGVQHFTPPVSSPSSSTTSQDGSFGVCPQHSSPWQFLTTILVIIDIMLHRRPWGGAG